MFHIRHIRHIRSFTKSANPVINNALVLVKHQLRSSHHDNNNNAHDDMANMATARRFIDDYMRRIESSKKKEMDKKEDCAGNFKCEITRKYKRGGEDCNCELVCMAKVSETMLIHEEQKSRMNKNEY
jgi:hypothetical protein